MLKPNENIFGAVWIKIRRNYYKSIVEVDIDIPLIMRQHFKISG